MLGVLGWLTGCRRAVRSAILCSPLFFGLAADVRAQPAEEGTDLVVDTWQIDAGLPHNSVTALLQTKDRYLWVGTSNGLARFDGLRFTTFRVMDNPGLKSNRILCLFEDRQGILWIGTQGGGLVSFTNGQFSSLTTAEGLSSDTVQCVGNDQAGNLWAGTVSGLNRWAGGRFESFFKMDGLPDDRVFAVLQPAGTSVLFATGQGLARFSGQRVVEAPGPSPNAVFALLQGQDGRLWAGGETGLFCLPDARAGGSPPLKLAAKPVLCLLGRQNGEIWFGTSAGDLCRVAPGTEPLATEQVCHFSSPVAALREDIEGNLWVGTAGDGLHRLKRRQLRLLPLAEDLGASSAVRCFESSTGELQFVADDRGLYSCEGGRIALVECLPLPADVVIQTAAGTRNGQVWIGTQGEGLFECRQGAATRISEREGLSDNSVQSLYAEDDGGLWIGTRNGGLNYLKDRAVTRFNTPWGFSGNFACVLAKDRQGSLWIGTTGDGLFQMEQGRFVAYTEQDGLPSGDVRALHPEPDGSLWVGTAKGLCRVKEGRVTAYPGRNGLANETILQLRSDREGNLWLGSGSGIFRVSKHQLNAYAEERAGFLVALPFGREDGLPALQCLPEVSSQPSRGAESRVWFLTTKGLVLGEQHGRQANPLTPAVVLEQVLVENQSAPLNGTVRVPPGKESLQFQYTALSLTAPEKLCFCYQLEGFDRDWSEPSTSRAARYPKVPPGQYRFRVVACNNDGLWDDTGASVAVVVLPFWWATNWFRLGLAAAAAGLLGGLYRLRQARRRELEKLRVRIASDLHDDVGSSLWSITLLSRLLAKHGEMGPQERQDVGEINRIAAQTSNSIRDIIWLINPAFDSLQDLLLRTRDFAGTALHGVNYRMHSEGVELTQKLSLDFRQNLFLFFKEALTNIARHASATVVEVRLEKHKDRWHLSIRDNGVGFDPAARTGGNGLRNLRARAAKMGATLEIRSQPGQGTTLMLDTASP
jgi:ligand-binding sensor domain-containing protein/signal transduction histidine kinase